MSKTQISLSFSPPVLENYFLPEHFTHTVFLLHDFSPICCFRFFCMRTALLGWIYRQAGSHEFRSVFCYLPQAAKQSEIWPSYENAFFSKHNFASSGKLFWSYVSSTTTPGWHLNYIRGLKVHAITEVIQMAPVHTISVVFTLNTTWDKTSRIFTCYLCL